MVSKASEDLPEPDSPVMTTRLLRGISTSMFSRLCSRAPRTMILSCMSGNGLLTAADIIAAVRKSDSEMAGSGGPTDMSCQYNSGGSWSLPLDSEVTRRHPPVARKRSGGVGHGRQRQQGHP